MKFRYHLQKVVDLKSDQKTQAEWMLSEAIGQLRVEEQSLQQLSGEKEDLQHRISHMQDRTTVAELIGAQQYVQHLEQQIRDKARDVENAHSEVQQKQTVLTEKMLDEKVWMKTRERALEKFKADYFKKEQDALDEMATVRFERHHAR